MPPLTTKGDEDGQATKHKKYRVVRSPSRSVVTPHYGVVCRNDPRLADRGIHLDARAALGATGKPGQPVGVVGRDLAVVK